MPKETKIMGLNRFEYEQFDNSMNNMLVEVRSTGETVIIIADHGRNATLAITNRTAHELRDFLNGRFPVASTNKGDE